MIQNNKIKNKTKIIMANCIIDSGYQLGCSSIGGAELVYVGTYSASTTYDFSADNVITGITGLNTAYLLEQDAEYAGITQTGQFSRENGTVFYETVLSVKMTSLDANLRNLLVSLGRAPLYAIVKSNAGEFYFAGVETAGRATAGTAGIGVLYGDMNGVTLEITWRSANGIYLLDEATFNADVTIG